MAESTLSHTYVTLMDTVARFLGYWTDSLTSYDDLESTEKAECDDCVQSGYRNFLYPLPIDGVPHSWSFLHPVTTLTTAADDSAYDLPDDFGGIQGFLTYAAGYGYTDIIVVGEGEIRSLQRSSPGTGVPTRAAVRPKAYAPTDGQRFELLLHPTPSSVWTLTYRYDALPNKLTATNLYPLGGMKHAETILESCLAVAETRMDDTHGVHQAEFMKRLAASVVQDRLLGPEFLGYNKDRSGRRGFVGRHDRWSPAATYNGAAMP